MARMEPERVGQQVEEAEEERGGPRASRTFVARGGLNVLCVAYRAATPRLIPRRPAATAAEPSRLLHLRGIRAEARKLWVACWMPPVAIGLAHLRHAAWWPHLL
jgi:hypothetical protein